MPETLELVSPDVNQYPRQGSMVCPCCGSRDTRAAQVHVGNVFDTAQRPHYVRRRQCLSCNSRWETVESIVVDSVFSADGALVM